MAAENFQRNTGMTKVARYQYQEVINLILFPSLIHSIIQWMAFLDQCDTFNYLQDTIMMQLGSVVMITMGVMKDHI